MGDSERRWSEKPVQISTGSVFLVPPESPKLPGGDDADGDVRKRRRSVSRSRSPGRVDRRRRRGSRSPSPNSNRDRESGQRGGRDRGRDRDSDRVKYAGMTGAQIERARAQERSLRSNKSSLTDEEYDEFRGMLLHLTLSRRDIREAMAFMYDKVESAKELASLLRLSLLSKKTPLPIKIARLYLLSDVLHNSGAPIKFASNFRVEIQGFLPEVFDDLGKARREIVGRLTAHQV